MKTFQENNEVIIVANHFDVINKETRQDEGDIHFLVKDNNGNVNFAHSQHSYINDTEQYRIDNSVIAIDEDGNELNANELTDYIDGQFK